MVETASSSASSLAPAGAQLGFFPSLAEAEEGSVDQVGQRYIGEVKYKVFKRHPTTERLYRTFIIFIWLLASKLTKTLRHPR